MSKHEVYEYYMSLEPKQDFKIGDRVHAVFLVTTTGILKYFGVGEYMGTEYTEFAKSYSYLKNLAREELEHEPFVRLMNGDKVYAKNAVFFDDETGETLLNMAEDIELFQLPYQHPEEDIWVNMMDIQTKN